MAHIKSAYKELGNTIPWLCDNMKNELKHALGDRPNSEFIIDPEGRIVALRDWSNPDLLRGELAKLVGEVKEITRVSDLNLKIESKPNSIRKGIVQRPALPNGMRSLKVEAKKSKHPYYVKLRCEADLSALRGEKGRLYLGFHLDPIHRVHWNNLAAPIEFEIIGIKDEELTPKTGKGPKVDVESDIDPREFVLDVNEFGNKSFVVRVRYFACSDDQGWCKAVAQEYVVTMEADRDGGTARRGGRQGGAGQRRRMNPGGKGMQRRNNVPPVNEGQRRGLRALTVEGIFQNDTNKDGKISRDELPPQLIRVLERLDVNGDGAIDKSEAKQIEERSRGRG